MAQPEREKGLVETLVGDGSPLLLVTGAALVFAGGFAVFLGIAGQFLPQDVAYLHLTSGQLCSFDRCRVVDFMVHDRIAFGGSLMAIGSLYVWLTLFPLRRGEAWAWWTLLVSSVAGFGSFLTYLGYGYLDTWHGLGTLLLAPIFAWGLIRSRSLVQGPRGIGTLFRPFPWDFRIDSGALGRVAMIAASTGMAVGGATIAFIGATHVFVVQDVGFMRTTKAALDAISPRLVPLMAHDRAGFGGGVFTTAVTVCCCLWCARPAVSLWETLLFSWLALAGCAIGVHFAIGYTTPSHLAPAVAGAILFGIGLSLSRRPMWRGRWSEVQSK